MSRYSPRAQGVERFFLLCDNWAQGETFAGMFNLMRFVTYSNVTNASPIWVTEATDGSEAELADGTIIHKTIGELYQLFRDNKAKLDEVVEESKAYVRECLGDKEKYRKADTGVWQTVHNSTYDIERKMFRVELKIPVKNGYTYVVSIRRSPTWRPS